MQRLLSRLLPVVAATLMAATAAHATSLDQSVDLQLVGDDSTGYTTPTVSLHTEAGSFLDTFRFTVASPSLVDITMITIGSGNEQAISFTGAWLNGIALNIQTVDNADGTRQSFIDFARAGLTGDMVLTVQGYAGGALETGSAIAASYSGVVNVVPAAAVPEPESYALFLAGLGLTGVLLSRRRKV